MKINLSALPSPSRTSFSPTTLMSSEGQSTTAATSEPHHEPLLLEAPSDNGGQPELQVGGTTVKLDRLGPLVVNSDGVSRAEDHRLKG